MSEKFRLDNKVAIVYGGSYGIGKGISCAFSDAGATVVIVSRDKEKGEAAVASLKGKEKLYIQGDVRNFSAHEHIVKEVLAHFKQIDIVVCCAGIYDPLHEVSEEEYDEKYINDMIDVNLKGSIFAVKTTVQHLRQSTSGRIIFISSITGQCTGMPAFSMYGATKSAQVGYARSLAVELAPFQITVNSVLPGNVLTEGLMKIGGGYIEDMKKSIPLKRLGTPEDIGHTVLFLASQEASFITGQEIVVDGGLAEREAELGQTLQMKDSLETQKQTNFNAVFNKIKKEKDNQIKDLELKLLSLKNDNQTLKHRNENLILEINMHKEAYTQLESDLKKVNDLNANLQEKLTTSINENRLSVEKTEKERLALENNIKELHVNIKELKKEKLRVMQELKTQYDNELEKEKASLLVAFELQKSALEECGKSDHDIRSSTVSIEEGIDELEIDRLQDKVKTLEAENARLKRASFESASSSPKSQRVQRTSELFPVEKLALRNLDVGSFIILCYDDTINQYTALNLAEEKYFLHPESFKTLAGTLGTASERRPWLFAYITEKEYCLAKKSNNKFNLPINTYFSRIHVKPYTN